MYTYVYIYVYSNTDTHTYLRFLLMYLKSDDGPRKEKFVFVGRVICEGFAFFWNQHSLCY